MIIERVELENFVSHRRSVIELGPGVIAIIGPNGAGKTSIVDAITYALFSVHSRGGQNTREPLVSLGATRATVRVFLNIGGRRYLIQKIIPRMRQEQTQAKLYEIDDGKTRLMATGVRSVEREVTRLIGIDLSVARLLMVSRQGEIDALLTDTETRKKFVNSILQLEAMENLYKSFSELIRPWESKLSKWETKLKSLEEELARLGRKKKELEEVSEKLNRLKSVISRVVGELEALQDERKRYEEVLAKYQKLQGEYESKRERMEEIARTIERLEKRIRDLDEEAGRLREEYSALWEKIDLLERLRLLMDEKASIEKSISELESLAAEELTLREKYATLSRLRDEYELLRAKLEELSGYYNEYMVYRRRLDELEKRRRKVEEEKRLLERRIAELLAAEDVGRVLRSADPKHALRTLESIEYEISEREEKLRSEIERLSREIGGYKVRIAELEEKIAKLSSAEGRCPVCERPLTPTQREDLIRKFRTQRYTAESALKRYEAKYREYRRKLDELKRIRERVRRLRMQVAEHISLLEGLERTSSDMESEESKIRQKLLDLWVYVSEYKDIRSRIESLKKSIESLQGVEERLREAEKAAARLADLRERYEKISGMVARLLSELAIEIRDPGDVDALGARVREARQAYERHLAEKRSLEQQLELLRAEGERLEYEIAGYGRELSRLRAELDALAERLEKLERLEEELSKLKEEYNRLVGRMEELEKEVSRLSDVERSYKDAKRRYESIRSFVKDLGRVRAAVKKLQEITRGVAREAVEYYLRDILQQFNIDFIDVELDEDYNVSIITRGGLKSVSMLSGGERTALAIAFRLAFARLAGTKLGTIILDEPTVHLDDARRRELVEIIRYGLGRTGLRQIIVVTHDRELEDAAETVIEVTRKAGGYSEVRLLTR